MRLAAGLLSFAAVACQSTDESDFDFRAGSNALGMGAMVPLRFHEHFMSLANALPVKGRIEDARKIASTTTGGYAHVQGLGWEDGMWAVTHSQPKVADQHLLVLCRDPTTQPGDSEGCIHRKIGHPGADDSHGGGGTQISGGVLLTSDHTKFPVLYNLDVLGDLDEDAELETLACTLPVDQGGAAGLAWDPSHRVHVASFTTGSTELNHCGESQSKRVVYATEGDPLDSQACEFKDKQIVLESAGQGLSQLFFDPYENKLVAIAGDRVCGQQVLTYQYFDLDGNIEEPVSIELEGPGHTPGPSLRWGGTVRLSAEGLKVVLGARSLGGPKGMRLHTYQSSVSTDLVQGAYAFAQGLYHGCYPQTLQPWGQALVPDNNWAWNWPTGWESIDAAFFDAGVWTFIQGSQFVTKIHGSTAVGAIQPLAALASNWPSSWDRVDAAVRHDNGAIYFFRGADYLRYEPATNTIGTWYLEQPRSIAGNFAWGWPNWDHVDAAVNGGDGFIYFVRDGEMLTYDIGTSGASLQTARFPCGFDGHADAMTSR